MAWEIGQRLDTNNCRWEQCQEYMIICEGLGPADDGGMQISPEFSVQDSDQDYTGHFSGLQKHRTQNTW